MMLSSILKSLCFGFWKAQIWAKKQQRYKTLVPRGNGGGSTQMFEDDDKVGEPNQVRKEASCF